MTKIKNVGVLVEHFNISTDNVRLLNFAAVLHIRFSNIKFEVVRLDTDGLHIKVKQGKHMSENYASSTTLRSRAKELFGKVIPKSTKLHISAITYKG